MLQPNDQSKSLIVANIEIIQDEHGRYNLNVLHKASPASHNKSKSPGKWLQNKGTEELIDELQSQVPNSVLEVIHGGDRAGTYAHELLAVSYAGWISPAFQLAVNQAFIDLRTNKVALPKPLTVTEQIEAIKNVYEFMLDIGLSDDYTRIMAKESLHNHLRALGNVGGQQQPLLPQTTETQAYFQIEDLRASLPKVSDKEWFNLRGTFGKVARLAIQAADPECQPHRIEKNVNGANRMVNMWPNDYRDIAIAAIKRHMERIANDDSERLV